MQYTDTRTVCTVGGAKLHVYGDIVHANIGRSLLHERHWWLDCTVLDMGNNCSL